MAKVTFDGVYRFNAPRQLIWSLMHDPAVNKEALPGCERFQMNSAAGSAVTIHLDAGPVCGDYDGNVTVVDAQEPASFSLALVGSGEGRSFSGDGRFTLTDSDEGTRLRYEGDVEITDPAHPTAERLLQTTANALVRQYLEAIARIADVRQGLTPNADVTQPAPRPDRTSSTIGVQDWLAEVRRDRRIAIFLVALFFLGLLTFVGAVVVAVLIGRWSTRRYARYLAKLVDEERLKREEIAS